MKRGMKKFCHGMDKICKVGCLELTVKRCQLIAIIGTWIAVNIIMSKNKYYERRKKMEKVIARIFYDVGGYYVCDEDLDYLDMRGQNYPSKAAAQRAAKELGYTHCIGSGSYTHPRLQKL